VNWNAAEFWIEVAAEEITPILSAEFLTEDIVEMTLAVDAAIGEWLFR